MKRIYKSLTAIAVLLLMSACEGSVSVLDNTLPGRPETKASSYSRQVTVATQGGGNSQFSMIVGDNVTLFGYENIGSPIDLGDIIENFRRPEWINLEDENVGGSYAKIMRIDDDETLQAHYRLEYDTIDWSKKTLLLAYGKRPYQDRPAAVQFSKQEECKYLLTVEIIPSIFTAYNFWRVAILVDKLEADAVIELTTPDYVYQD